MDGPAADIVNDLAQRVRSIKPKARRRLIAIAGPPASGKSTFAENLVAALGPSAALVPMDGFHLDNRLLDARNLRHRKGAPETFDVAGFVHMIRRLGTDPIVTIPVFDRARDIAIAGASEITDTTDTAVVEGNYLLLNEAPWTDLHPLWDLSIFLDVPEETLTNRLTQRWRSHRLSPEDAESRARLNDLPNALRVTQDSAKADVTL